LPVALPGGRFERPDIIGHLVTISWCAGDCPKLIWRLSAAIAPTLPGVVASWSKALNQCRRTAAGDPVDARSACANNCRGRFGLPALLDDLADLRRCRCDRCDRDDNRACLHRTACQRIASTICEYFGDPVAEVGRGTALCVGEPERERQWSECCHRGADLHARAANELTNASVADAKVGGNVGVGAAFDGNCE
jgi:hypothetical protein